jgi:hypothetical protein
LIHFHQYHRFHVEFSIIRGSEVIFFIKSQSGNPETGNPSFHRILYTVEKTAPFSYSLLYIFRSALGQICPTGFYNYGCPNLLLHIERETGGSASKKARYLKGVGSRD